MILDNYKLFLDNFFEKLQEFKIDVTKYQLDHLGYQASSNSDYDRLKPQFRKIGKEMPEQMVGGRRVGIFKLNQPLQYKNYSIPAVELVAPKTNQVCPSALEHAEFVINEDFESLTKKYPALNWNKTKINQPKFPMVTLKLDDHIQIKFHYQPVLEIVK